MFKRSASAAASGFSSAQQRCEGEGRKESARRSSAVQVDTRLWVHLILASLEQALAGLASCAGCHADRKTRVSVGTSRKGATDALLNVP